MTFYKAYCVDEITILKWTGYDAWNEPLSGETITVKGYVEWKTRLVRNIKGEEVVSAVTVHMPKKIDAQLGRELRHEDRLIVGGSLEWGIIAIQEPKDFSSPHYVVALMQVRDGIQR